jgi:hypothetical protein
VAIAAERITMALRILSLVMVAPFVDEAHR